MLCLKSNAHFDAHAKFFLFILCFFSLTFFAAALDYVVQKGETLYSISRDFSVSVDEICRENNIQKTGTLKAGQKLRIPTSASAENSERKTETYKVTQNDTLFGIARKFEMSVADIKKLNTLSTDTIKPGQQLKVYSTDNPADSGNYAGKQGDASLLWPVKTSSVTYVTGKISGVQLVAKKDESVTSISSGTVMYSGLYRGFGQVVFVQNSTGYVYVYTGLAGVSVQKGDNVAQGSILGKTGGDALNGKSQLTFMVYKNGKPMDPASAPRG